ncbi:MAG: hypothetical protein K2R98_21575 [Gemmataceae bacterium]|nr:hypothetical protein [Gemmataceae bacterium]
MPAEEVLERNVAKSAILSQYQMPEVIPLLDVLRVLNRAKINFVLVGAHGLASWRGKPRATEDVDVIVAAKHVKKATKTLLAAFPHLEAVDLPVVVQLRQKESKDVAIDVMKPMESPHRDVFKHTHALVVEGEPCRIPTLEMAIVMKFAPMISLNRPEKEKYQDAHDFLAIIDANKEIDLAKLSELGDRVYLGGGAEVVELVRQARAGEKLKF